jgi:hypothetical protein
LTSIPKVKFLVESLAQFIVSSYSHFVTILAGLYLIADQKHRAIRAAAIFDAPRDVDRLTDTGTA